MQTNPTNCIKFDQISCFLAKYVDLNFIVI